MQATKRSELQRIQSAGLPEQLSIMRT